MPPDDWPRGKTHILPRFACCLDENLFDSTGIDFNDDGHISCLFNLVTAGDMKSGKKFFGGGFLGEIRG
jgi:hypothetical protein